MSEFKFSFQSLEGEELCILETLEYLKLEELNLVRKEDDERK